VSSWWEALGRWAVLWAAVGPLDGGEGKIWEMAGAGGRRTSVVVGGGDGVSFERILKFWDVTFLKMGGRKWHMRFLYFEEFSFFFFNQRIKKYKNRAT